MVRLSTKGQLVLPKEIRDRHRWGPGTELVVDDEGAVVVLRAAVPRTSGVDEVFGCLASDRPPLSLEDMDAAILAEARRRSRS